MPFTELNKLLHTPRYILNKSLVSFIGPSTDEIYCKFAFWTKIKNCTHCCHALCGFFTVGQWEFVAENHEIQRQQTVKIMSRIKYTCTHSKKSFES